jgi:soluble lytic murein transglycosylase-like protein
VLLTRPSRLLAAALCAIPLCAAAHALERVTLRNGFSYDCARREPLDRDHIRLIFPATSPTETPNFIDLSTQAIVSVEALPDPPPPQAKPAPAPSPNTPDIPTLLAAAGAQHNLDVDLLLSVIHTESNGRADAISRAGARGLMQLMPATARDLGVDDAFQPGQNIAGGSSYLDTLLTRYHNDLALALAAYNAGPAAVDRYHGIPPFRETRAYVVRVMSEFKRRKLATAPHPTPALTTLASR